MICFVAISFVSKLKIPTTSPIWFTPDLIKLMKDTNHFLKKAKLTNNPGHSDLARSITNLTNNSFKTAKSNSQKMQSSTKYSRLSKPINRTHKYIRKLSERLYGIQTLRVLTPIQPIHTTEYIPHRLEKALVIPIPKVHTKTASDYRPISLLLAPDKIMELLVHDQLYTHLEIYAILYDKQHSFRKNKSMLCKHVM